MTCYQTALRPWLHDTTGLIIEQLESAMSSPTNQFAEVDIARGAIPVLWSRLKDDQSLALNFLLLLENYIDPNHWGRVWTELAKEPPDVFAKSASVLISKLNALKTLLDLPPQGDDDPNDRVIEG